MPALSFKKMFRAKIEDGSKGHSIRAKRKRAWKVGDQLALYTGMRTKYCKLIFRTVVIKVEDITISVENFSPGNQRLSIIVGDAVLSHDEVETLAVADGFNDGTEMMRFWEEKNTLPSRGDLIHWQFPRKEA